MGNINSSRAMTKLRRSVALAAIGGVMALSAMATTASAADPIKMGVFLSLTGPGAAGAAPNKMGVEMAVEELNAAGGIMGRQIELVYADDQANPTVAVSEMTRLVHREGVDVVVGPQNSQVNLAALPILAEGKVASLSMTGSSALTPQAGPYHFSVLPSAAASGRNLGQYTAAHSKKPAIIFDDASATLSGMVGFRDELKKAGVELASEQQYKFHPSDTTPQLLALRRAEPDFLAYFAASQDDVGIVQKNLQEIGWEVEQATSLAGAVNPGLVIKIAGPDAYKNMVAQTLAQFTYCPDSPEGSPVLADFVKKMNAYTKAKGLESRASDYLNVAVGYEWVHLFKQAIEATGSTDGEVIAKWIEGNAGSLKRVIANTAQASSEDHFLSGPDAYTMVVHPEKRNEYGLQQRASCGS